MKQYITPRNYVRLITRMPVLYTTSIEQAEEEFDSNTMSFDVREQYNDQTTLSHSNNWDDEW